MKTKYGILALCLAAGGINAAEPVTSTELQQAYETLKSANAVMGECISNIEIDGLNALKESESCKKTMNGLSQTTGVIKQAQQVTSNASMMNGSDIATLSSINSAMEIYISQAEYLKTYIDIVIENMLKPTDGNS